MDASETDPEAADQEPERPLLLRRAEERVFSDDLGVTLLVLARRPEAEGDAIESFFVFLTLGMALHTVCQVALAVIDGFFFLIGLSAELSGFLRLLFICNRILYYNNVTI